VIVLTLEQLLTLHALVIDSTGGSAGLRDLGRLESAIATQTRVWGGVSLTDKSAAMIRGIIGDLTFADGNKRTAMLAGITFLQVNGLTFKAAPGELEQIAVDIAMTRMDVPRISAWLQTHTIE